MNKKQTASFMTTLLVVVLVIAIKFIIYVIVPSYLISIGLDELNQTIQPATIGKFILSGWLISGIVKSQTINNIVDKK